MPVTFTDERVKAMGKRYEVPYTEGDDMADYRKRVADADFSRWEDHVQAVEIETGRPWNQWNREDKHTLLDRNPPSIFLVQQLKAELGR